jgi:parallel beta-helix repeat protein
MVWEKRFFIILMMLAIQNVNFSQPFNHPGINQTKGDLDFLKEVILEGRQPYQAAFLRLKAAADTPFRIQAYVHVMRGPYGKPNIGGDDLRNGANLAYDNALLWYLTGEKKYAVKAIAILNAWSATLWDFDFNDAKLLAAWTGHLLCNAAELLKYSHSGWSLEDQDSFRGMLQKVYYPLLRYYYPQANGNWDGAIIHSLVAMGIYLDNREMFNNAVNHYLRAPFNGSIFKYIYPNGQCQETPRDQAHVQLGLGEFAGAAQVAYSQGVDLFAVGNNRLALGFEFTARYLLGELPSCYCKISDRATALRDDYEVVSVHYKNMGIALPWTQQAADSIRPKASRSILSSVREITRKVSSQKLLDQPYKNGYISGAKFNTDLKPSENAVIVNPGESVQDAINKASVNNKSVFLKSGIHKIPQTLKIPSNTHLSGNGAATILFLDPASASRDVMENASPEISNIKIQNLVVEGSNKTDPGQDPNSTRSYRGGYNRGGIIFRANNTGQIDSILLRNITVRNCTYNGVFISGGSNIEIVDCDFSENGGNVVPGPKLQHNLLLSHCSNIKVSESRLSTSPFGAGIVLEACINAVIQNNEIARNAFHGVLINESARVLISDNLIEANDAHGIMLPFLHKGSKDVTIRLNLIHYNAGMAIVSYATSRIEYPGNTLVGNTSSTKQTLFSNEQKIFTGDDF